MLMINEALYGYIITNFGAYYEQNQEKVQSNLNNTPEDNRWYLGTYFPKSFKESYVIFSDIFAVLRNYGFLKNKNKVNILDLGSGTGGQIFGLLQVFHEKIDKQLDINIYSIDGNKNALEIQKKILENYWKVNFSKHNINIFYYCEVFNSGDDIAPFLSEKFEKNSIDIALSFKCLSEILKYDNAVYTKALKACENILKNDAILVLEDVTMPIDTYSYPYKKYIPYTINENIKRYLSDNHLLSLVTPLCCFYNINNCTKDDCYAQCITYSKMLIYNDLKAIKDIECKIIYNLFIKNIDLYGNLYEFLTTMNAICSNFCMFKHDYKSCYCACKSKFKDYFYELNFNKSQFSLVRLSNLYKEYTIKH